MGLCDVLKCQIKLMCYIEPPQIPVQNYTYTPLMPAGDDVKQIIILWITTRPKADIPSGESLPYPNHFIPLVRETLTESISTNLTADPNVTQPYSDPEILCLTDQFLTEGEFRLTIDHVFAKETVWNGSSTVMGLMQRHVFLFHTDTHSRT